MRHNNKKFLFQQLTLVSPSIANRIESNRIESDRPTTRRIESNRIRDKKKRIEPNRTELLEIMKETNRIGPIRTELRFFWFVSASASNTARMENSARIMREQEEEERINNLCESILTFDDDLP